jgi:hypothetical protein
MTFLITKPLIEQQAEAIVTVDTLAGEKRLQYITNVPGQEITYSAKLADAQAYILAGYPSDVTPYHWVEAEATATGATPIQVADLIVLTGHAWAEVGSKIEGARQAAKIAINNASSIVDIRTALSTFTTYLSTL